MKDLDTLRSEIDVIDEQMKKLFVQRMALVKEVGLYKKVHQLPVLNQNREQQMLDKHQRSFNDDDLWAYYEAFLKHVMALSKEYQK